MEKLKSSITNMALVLTSVAVITGGILAALNQLTKDPIAYQKEKALADGIKTVMACNDLVVAKSDVVKQTDAKGKELVYTIYQTQDKQGKDLGAAVESSTMGFGGNLKILVGFDPEGKILGYTLLEHAETPGLGAKADKWFQEGGKGNIIGNPANGIEDTNNLGTASKGEVAALCAWIGDLNWDGRNNYAKNCYNIGEVKVYDNTNKNYIYYPDFIRRNIGTTGAEETHLVNNYNLKVNIAENREAINNGSNNGTYYGIAIANGDVTSGALCAKLGFGFRQNLGSGSPCFDQAQGFVAQISAAGYSTMYNTYSDVTIPNGIEAYAGVVKGDNLSLVAIENKIAASEPVILKLAEGTNAGLFNFMPTTGASKYTGNALSGSDGTVTGGANKFALAQPKGQEVGFYPVDNGVTIPAGKAYLVDGSSVKGFTFVFDDDATAIEETLSNSPLKGENIYNVAGQRIQKMQKGINIVNGKKIAVK